MSKQKDLIDRVFADYEIEVEGGYSMFIKRPRLLVLELISKRLNLKRDSMI